jgi:hypothetical protein
MPPDGCLPYQPAIRSDFGNSHHGVINKTYSVVHLDKTHQANRPDPARMGPPKLRLVQGGKA